MNTFLFTNKVKTATAITASSSSALYPVAAIRDDNAASTWRSLDNFAPGIHTIVIDMGAAVAINMVSLINVNFGNGSAKVEWNSSDSWASPAGYADFDLSGILGNPAHANLTLKITPGGNYRYWRIYVYDLGNPDGFSEIGEVFMGVRADSATGQDFQSTNEQTFPDPNIVHETEWLQAHVYVRDIDDVRTFQLEWAEITYASMVALRVMKRAVKNSGYPFVFAPDGTTTPMEAFFVRMTGDFVVSQASPIHYTVKLNLKETARGRSLPA